MQEFLDPSATATGESLAPTGTPDDYYSARAIELGWRAAGQTDPNPLVGAVVVSEGEVVGEGYHCRCGLAHAEVVALDAAGDRAAGATLYVSLEPCAHYGRTPPCVDRIIRAGVKRVVTPLIDPDKNVFGRGIEKLRSAGIQVDVGCQARSALLMNLGYYKQRLGLGPTVTLKMAATIDGKIASAPKRRDAITGPDAGRYTHRLRAHHHCVVVGIDTALTDRPRLDCRGIDCCGAPVPVVFDGRLRLPAANCWTQAGRPFVVVTARGAAPGRVAELKDAGGRVIECDAQHGRIVVKNALEELSKVGLRRVLVEGGAKIFTSFLKSGAWDAMYLFQAPKIFGAAGVSLFEGDEGLSFDVAAADASRIGDDVLFRYLNRRTLNEIESRLDAGDAAD